jgi:8-oxo-dGTP diphosphatase
MNLASNNSFLRLGVQSVIVDDDGHVLLSRRGDLDIWNLPGGRVDSGETLREAAAREVLEETGLAVHLERAVGLYYLEGWNRLNVLYTGWPLGGELQERTSEARANQFFASTQLPEMLWEITVLDALAETRHKPRIIQTAPEELRRVGNQLRWRWVKNLVAGRPEPRFPHFDVQAVGLVWDDAHQRVLTLPGEHGRALPRATCDGQAAPWLQLTEAIYREAGLEVPCRWVGLWQDTVLDRIEFVFAMTVEETDVSGGAEWSVTRSAALHGRDAAYVDSVKSSYHRDAVWVLAQEDRVQLDETIVLRKD